MQPSKKNARRYQVLVAAVDTGAISGSALNEMDEAEEEDSVVDEEQECGRPRMPHLPIIASPL